MTGQDPFVKSEEMGSLLSVIRHFTESVSCEQQNTFDMHENYPCTYSYWELGCTKAFKHFWATFCRRPLTDIFNSKTGINILLLHFQIRDWGKLKEFTRLCETTARIKNYY